MAFKHGGDVYSAAQKWGIAIDQVVDFSANINPFGLKPNLLNTVLCDLQVMLNYPDPEYRGLKSALSRRYEIPIDTIVVGNGGIELIYRILQALKPGKIGILAPTFIEYERAALSYGCESVFYETQNTGFRVNLEELISFAKKVDAIFICNPNNPTGTLYTAADLLALAQACPSTHLIIDEAFIEFVPHMGLYTLLDAVSKYSNVTVIRSLTKVFSMPGLRLGFMVVGDKNLLRRVLLTLNPWNVNGIASTYMTALLDTEQEPFDAGVFVPLRQYLIDSLSGFKDLVVYPSETNYLFFRYGGPLDLCLALEPYHILIRDCSNYKGLGYGDYRVAVKTERENRYLIQCLTDILKE